MIQKFMCLGINVERTRFMLSAISEFKSLDKKQLLMNLNVRYKDESGIDAGNILDFLLTLKNKGGLRREYFSLIAKELFDPQFGLFRLSENKRGIQPNPLASIIPNYLLYFEFAGIMLAKVMNYLLQN